MISFAPTLKKIILSLVLLPVTLLVINNVVLTDTWREYSTSVEETPNFGLSDYGLCSVVTYEACEGGKSFLDIFGYDRDKRGCVSACREPVVVLLLYVLWFSPSILTYVLLSKKQLKHENGSKTVH